MPDKSVYPLPEPVSSAKALMVAIGLSTIIMQIKRAKILFLTFIIRPTFKEFSKLGLKIVASNLVFILYQKHPPCAIVIFVYFVEIFNKKNVW